MDARAGVGIDPRDSGSLDLSRRCHDGSLARARVDSHSVQRRHGSGGTVAVVKMADLPAGERPRERLAA